MKEEDIRHFLTLPLLAVCIILFSVSPSLAKTYDFNYGGCKAYEGGTLDNPPASYKIGFEMDEKKYTALSTSDDMHAQYSTKVSGAFEFQRFECTLDELSGGDTLSITFEGHALVGNRAGLLLFIWNYSSGAWEQIGYHNGYGDGTIHATIKRDTSHYISSQGVINILAETKHSESGYSCPFLYVWDGSRFNFITDMSGAGGMGYEDASGTYPFWHPFPKDTVVVNGSLLKEDSGKYRIVIAEDQNEITYLDEVELYAIDHAPGVEVVSSLAYSYSKEYPFFLHTIREPKTPVSARNETGEDIRRVISEIDHTATRGEQFRFDAIEIDLGDLAAAKQIKLVYNGWMEWPTAIENNMRAEYLKNHPDEKYSYPNYVEVINEQGEWEKIEFPFVQGKPKTFVLDISKWFKTDDYRIRINTWFKSHFDYIAVDTSPDEELRVQKLPLTSANLYWKGPALQRGEEGGPLLPDFTRTESSSLFYVWEGRFTKYGDVMPLLAKADDKFVIMHAGDAVELEFTSSLPANKNRDYLVRTNAFYKRDFVRHLLGQKIGQVEPLPFQGMLFYPYPDTVSYPYDEEHLSYLKEFNTRKFNRDFFKGHDTIYTDFIKVVYTPPSTGAVGGITGKIFLWGAVLFGVGLIGFAGFRLFKTSRSKTGHETSRRVIQILSLALFFFLFFTSVFTWTGAIPHDLFLKTNPLAALAVLVTAPSMAEPFALALIVVISAMLMGRAYCGYVCPLGVVLDAGGKITRAKRRYRPSWARYGRGLKHVVLVFLLVAGLLGFSALAWFDPLVLLTRNTAFLIDPLLHWVGTAALDTLRPLAARLNWDGLIHITLQTPTYRLLFFSLIWFGVIVGFSLWRARLWCRYLCPLGALLGILGRWAPIRKRVTDECTGCGTCVSACPMGAISEDPRTGLQVECITCQRCASVCPEEAIHFLPRYQVSEVLSDRGAGLSRRYFFATVAVGVTLGLASRVEAWRLGSTDGLIRPPGALPEEGFLDTCLRCGQCLDVCPTNTLQPALWEAGWEGIWTPRLDMSLAACDPHCNRCGQFCPTGSIRPLAMDERIHVKIGTAVINKDRCMVWKQGERCPVCYRVCPSDAIGAKEENGLQKPVVIANRCNGCGRCERDCPVKEPTAIYVVRSGEMRLATGSYHQEARRRGYNFSGRGHLYTGRLSTE